MGESYSKLDTAPLIGNIVKRLMSTVCFSNNITVNKTQESCHKNMCADKIQKKNKLVPLIEFL